MKNFVAIAVLSLASVTAFAQTGGVPPEQTPAGEPGKFKKPTAVVAPATTDTTTMAKPATKSERKAARKAKREAKVGDKPLN